jgi:curved DNA-binding protein CbpA
MSQSRSHTHYETLHIDRRATAQRVRLAYRRMAQKFHPDKNRGQDDSADLMAQINHAYAVLSDPAQRAAYDQALDADQTARTASSAAAAARTFIPDNIGWGAWLLFLVISLSLITVGYVVLRTELPAQPPAIRTPVATHQAAPMADSKPFAPIEPIRAWVEPPKSNRPVHEETDPVRQLVRDGVKPSR